MALQRTLCGPSSTASDLVSPMTAHFAAAYGVRMPNPNKPAVDDTLMMAPLPCAFMSGATLRAQRKCESSDTARQWLHSAGSMSSTNAVGPFVPALFTSTSTPPSSMMAVSSHASSESPSARSTLRATAPGKASRNDASDASSTSHTCTCAPLAMNAAAILRPIPLAAAVMMTRCAMAALPLCCR